MSRIYLLVQSIAFIHCDIFLLLTLSLQNFVINSRFMSSLVLKRKHPQISTDPWFLQLKDYNMLKYWPSPLKK